MKTFWLMLALSLLQAAAHAQTWPMKAVRAVVPVGAGSSTDIVHRLVMEQLSTALGQPIIVENRVGAGGTIGTASVATANADGYTLLANGSAHTIAPALYKSLPYDPARDFVPVAPVGTTPSVLVVSPATGITTAEGLATAAKVRPGTLNFSSVGNGTATHLSAERFAFSAGINVVHVPFKGGAEAMVEVLARRVDFFFGPVALVLPNIHDGKLVALAVNSTKRSPALPTTPTLEEAGYHDAEYPIWFGIFAPAGTPREIVNLLNRTVSHVLHMTSLRQKLSNVGVEPMVMTADDFKRYVEREIALNGSLARQIGLKAD